MRGKSKIFAYLTSNINQLWHIDMIAQSIQTQNSASRKEIYTKTE